MGSLKKEMLKSVLVTILGCVFGLCIYTAYSDTEWGSVYHSHPYQDCYGEIYDDGYQMGYIHKNHPWGDPDLVPVDEYVWHEHEEAFRIVNGKRERSDRYYSEQRTFYCGTYKNGGPKPSQREYPEDNVQEAPQLVPNQKLAITWDSLKRTRM